MTTPSDQTQIDHTDWSRWICVYVAGEGRWVDSEETHMRNERALLFAGNAHYCCSALLFIPPAQYIIYGHLYLSMQEVIPHIGEE